MQSRVEQIMFCHVHKINKGIAQRYMKQYFLSQIYVHSYSTRLSTKSGYCITRVKRSGTKYYCYTGSKLWKNLPADISIFKEYKPFKDDVKHFLLPEVV